MKELARQYRWWRKWGYGRWKCFKNTFYEWWEFDRWS